MKRILASACFFSLAANLAAFDLPSVNTAALRGASPELPAVKMAASGPEIDLASDWADLRAGFFRAEKPAELYSLLGVYKGRLHPLYEREDYTVPFVMAVYRDALTGAVKAAFPMPPNNSPETVTLKLTAHGAEFADAWGGRARVVIRREGSKLYLFTNLYSDETYGVCEPAAELPFPGGDVIRARGLEDDMPHGAIAGAQDYARLAADFGKGGAPDSGDLLAWNAGRLFTKDNQQRPDGLLLAGWDVPPQAAFKLVALTPGVAPAFYENLDPMLVPGLKVLLNEAQKNWSAPSFSSTGGKFEKLTPSYDKGYSRFEVRKTADKRIILRNDWKSDLGGFVTSGTDYAVLTKNVTPK